MMMIMVTMKHPCQTLLFLSLCVAWHFPSSAEAWKKSHQKSHPHHYHYSAAAAEQSRSMFAKSTFWKMILPRGGETSENNGDATTATSTSTGTTRTFISQVDHSDTAADNFLLQQELDLCEGEIIDPHLHTAPWFYNDPETLLEELTANNISKAFLYNPYPKGIDLPYDVNTYTADMAKQCGGRLYALASLNTTHDNWSQHRQVEMQRLRDGLADANVVLGTKLAPPHTCLPLQGPVMDDVLQVVSESQQKLVALHIGTTPFCGPIGAAWGIECDCGEQCVNPALLIPYIQQHPTVRFVLLHSGHEFMPPDSPYYYNFQFTDECIRMAKHYDNVYLSISALFAQDANGTLRYPGGFETVRKMKLAGVTHKVFWGSDASWDRGMIRPVLLTAIKAMRQAGWTPQERAWALRGCARHVFRIPSSAP